MFHDYRPPCFGMFWLGLFRTHFDAHQLEALLLDRALVKVNQLGIIIRYLCGSKDLGAHAVARLVAGRFQMSLLRLERFLRGLLGNCGKA